MNDKKSSSCPEIVVTVCVTTYNHVAYIEEAIESIFSQNIENIHVILADDASTDDTGKICHMLKRKYPKQITLIQHPTNIGLTENIDSIYKKIPNSTKYISWFSGDDIMLPGKFLKQIEFFDEHPDYVMCYHDALVRDDKRDVSYRYNNSIAGQKPYEGRIEKRLIEDGRFICALSVLVRYDQLKHIKHNKYLSIYNDWAYLIEIAMQGKVGYLDEVLGIYRRHATNITRTHLDSEGPVRVLSYIQEKYGFHDSIKKSLIRHYSTFAWKNLYLGKLSKFIEFYCCSFRIVFKKPAYFKSFLYWHILPAFQRIGLLIKTGRILR